MCSCRLLGGGELIVIIHGSLEQELLYNVLKWFFLHFQIKIFFLLKYLKIQLDQRITFKIKLSFILQDNPTKTASTLRGNFYITGDRGYMDEDGYFWFVSRADDIILSSG